MVNHVVLLGDSIFDNGPYVPARETVSDHLSAILPAGWRSTLLAKDGAVVSSVAEFQIERIPRDATHLVLSVGGNNALAVSASFLGMKANTIRDALAYLAQPVQDFSKQYTRLLDTLRSRNLPLIVCTVYDAVPDLLAGERLGLNLFNDVITRNVIRSRATMLDLRDICTEADDYSEVSPIEPSSAGGAKIAKEILTRII